MNSELRKTQFNLKMLSQMAGEQANQLENLSTVMTLYSQGTFTKDSLQWTKCVVKYLYDVYSHLEDTIIVFLVEVGFLHNFVAV